MTYSQYWDVDCELVKYYREAAKIKRDLTNQTAWLHGAYIYEAVADLAPILRMGGKKGTRPKPYRDSPYDLYAQSEKPKKQEQGDKKARSVMEMFMIANNKRFEQGGGKDGG